MLNEINAISIAQKFIQRNYTDILCRNAVLREDIWMITLAAENNVTMTVGVDANSGEISGFSLLQSPSEKKVHSA